ncbi:MAG TPA: BON domain-containing protein [Bryobacteraceae bacterium]|jgi:hypothetical protein
MFRIQAAVLVGAATICLTLGCGSKSVSDQALTTDIQSKLYADATTKAANINVAVKDGVVTLSGDVPSSDVELEAMKVANGTAGVRSVTDQLKVNAAMASNAAPPPGQPQAQPSYPPPSATPAQSPAPAPAAASAPPPEAAPAPAPAETAQHEEPVRPVFVTVPAGQRLSVRMIDGIDSSKNTVGQEFQASLDAPVTSGDRVVIPAGTPCSVALASVKSAGRIKGQSEVAVVLSSVHYQGRTYAVNTTAVEQQGKARGKQTAVRTGIGAAAGALIGGLAGGGKGAAIGSAVGGGAGFGVNALTHGQQVKIPSETVLTFQLQAPLRVERQ